MDIFIYLKTERYTISILDIKASLYIQSLIPVSFYNTRNQQIEKKFKKVVDMKDYSVYYIRALNEAQTKQNISVFENQTGNVNYLRTIFSEKIT